MDNPEKPDTGTGTVFHGGHRQRLSVLDGVPLASFRSRAGAFLTDGFLLLLFLSLVRIGPVLLQRRPGGGIPDIVLFDIERLWDLAIVIAYFGLATYAGKGQTPGKRLFRIRVVSLVGERLTLWQCAERALGYVASTLEAGFGFYQYFLHPNRQTVHDRIAETIVVREGLPPTPAAPAAIPGRRRRRRKRGRH